jgi:UDP-3-O-[3-hydroxymyristoyl] N-acetylglucosamine deacetylase
VTRSQTTLRTNVSIEGVGLHSGHPVRARFCPAPAGHGIVFVRTDHPETPIPARIGSASTFDFATTLASGGVSVGTVEHVLSAAFGEGLDNCTIELDGPEVPILDGSGLTITYEIDFPHPVVGRQELTVAIRPEEYSTRIAPARTFGFARDVEAMRARGLARGGTLHNAVVLDDEGVLSGPLRFRDEFVRHKVLDLLGDLALLGATLDGHIFARRAGHAMHIEFAKALSAAAARPATAAPAPPAAEQARRRATGRG